MKKLRSDAFYAEYHGHRVEDLHEVIAGVCAERPRLWLLGDSSVDNKYWLGGARAAAANGYAAILDPPTSVRDVCHALNVSLAARGGHSVAVNCAVEESTLGERATNLLAQDEVVREYVADRDVLVVSVGGNDVALRPTARTIWNVLKAVFLNGGATALGARSWGLPYLTDVFGNGVADYVRRVIGNVRPRAVVVCMIYFPDENRAAQSWAGGILAALRYNSRPDVLQAIIRAVFEYGTKAIRLDGTVVVPCPLFEAMDGKVSSLYVARVEPSVTGGEAMAELILFSLDKAGVRL